MRIKCIVNRDFKMSVEVGVAKSNTVKKLFSAPCQATDKAIKDKANQLPEAIIKHLSGVVKRVLQNVQILCFRMIRVTGYQL